MPVILAIDLGSSQLKLLAMDENSRVLASVTSRYSTKAPCAGWLMQEPSEWVEALKKGFEELGSLISLKEISVLSFSGHMSGLVMTDRDGEVLYPCIMLSDTRSEAECEAIRKQAGDLIRRMTGNPVINAFSLPKLLWMKEREPEIYRRAQAWISPKDYLRFLFTGKLDTEYTDAYNSLCVDRETGKWRGDVIRAAGLDPEKFPEIHAPADPAGTVRKWAADTFGIPEGIPVVYGGADMACGAVGNGLFEQGDSTLTLGTCATFLAMVPREKEESFGKVTFHMHALPGRIYALGSHFNGGQAVNWFSGLFSADGDVDYELVRKLSREAEEIEAGCGGMITIPFLAGSGSPYFDSGDRQSVIGMDMTTTKARLFRSQLEGISYNLKQTSRLLEWMQDSGLNPIVLGGGGVRVGVWPQIIADVFEKPLLRAENADASAVGAAFIGGYGVGIFDDLKQAAKSALKISGEILPDAKRSRIYAECYEKYLKLYELLRRCEN